ncbi:Ulp1 family isopeptidase [Myxococcus qinghaiensis]|uniref:Ulp1 family isopeptidase n=1 Tax=Myxococcus qinghaiensis TaxID=2906758 RepID=UPI0020A7B057|nr:Ulp1 family isopeptidase [Myxococcus qinghaiensis]MCP3162283.1 Ulp1 family isopeptidase [Myxococcus qinghaiensis]
MVDLTRPQVPFLDVTGEDEPGPLKKPRKEKTASSILIDLNKEADEALSQPAHQDLSHVREVLEEPGSWLTDDVINHVVSNYLEPLMEDTATFQYLTPSVAQAAALTPQVLNDLQRSGDVVFIPINLDNRHWSLLVYFAQSNVCIHYDSLRGHNDAFAHHLFNYLQSAGFISGSCDFLSTAELTQRDGYNCGAFMLSVILEILKANGQYPSDQQLQGITTRSCDNLRKTWLSELPATQPFGSASGSSSSRAGSSRGPWTPEQALSELLWFGLNQGPKTDQRDAQASAALTRLLFATCAKGPPRDLRAALRACLKGLGLPKMTALFHAFKRCPGLLLTTYDRFIADYEKLNTSYRGTKRVTRKIVGIDKPETNRPLWPSLQHDGGQVPLQKKVPHSKDYYKADRSAWAHEKLSTNFDVGGDEDLRAWLHTLVNLSLWRKIFSNTYAHGRKGRGVAHLLELTTPFGQVLVHNHKYTSGKGTTRFLLKLTNTFQRTDECRGLPRTYLNGVAADPVFLDASYGDELKLLEALKRTCGKTDAQVATLMLAMMDRRREQPGDLFLKTEVTAEGVTVVEDSEKWEDMFDGARSVRSGPSLAQVVHKWTKVTCPAGLILIYLCSHFFLAEPRHALPLFLGNLHALALVEAGLLTFNDLLTALNRQDLGEEGSLFPSNNFGDKFREVRLPLLHISGYYDSTLDHLDYKDHLDCKKEKPPLMVNTRELLARQQDQDGGALFALHKVLFMQFLCWLCGVDVTEMLEPIWEG